MYYLSHKSFKMLRLLIILDDKAVLHFVKGRAKSPTVPQRRELATGTRAAGQGGK